MKTQKERILEINDYEELRSYLNNLMEKHYSEALNKAYKEFDVKDMKELQEYDRNMGVLDCGWLLWTFIDKDLYNHVKDLKYKRWGVDTPDMRLDSPINIYGTTIKAFAADIIREKLANDSVNMAFEIHLD